MIERIDHIVLTVRDVERAVAFYVRVLGMDAVSFAGGRRALRFGEQKINLQVLGEETRNFAGIGSGDLCLVTRMGTEDLLAHLAGEGVEIVEGPVEKSGALGPICSVYFNDPDGNLIEVQSIFDCAGLAPVAGWGLCPLGLRPIPPEFSCQEESAILVEFSLI